MTNDRERCSQRNQSRVCARVKVLRYAMGRWQASHLRKKEARPCNLIIRLIAQAKQAYGTLMKETALACLCKAKTVALLPVCSHLPGSKRKPA